MTNKPETLEEAEALPNGPVAKFYMVKYAPEALTRTWDLKNMGCDEIRRSITAYEWFQATA